jgi:hypothetical protein
VETKHSVAELADSDHPAVLKVHVPSGFDCGWPAGWHEIALKVPGLAKVRLEVTLTGFLAKEESR